MRRIRRINVASMAQQAMRASSRQLAVVRRGRSRHARHPDFEAMALACARSSPVSPEQPSPALVKSDPNALGIAAGAAIDQVIGWLPAFFRKES